MVACLSDLIHFTNIPPLEMKKPNVAIYQFAFVLFFSISWAASAQPERVFVDCLLEHFDLATISQIVFTPLNPFYTSILNFYVENLRFATPDTPKPLVIVTPLRELHIQAAICCSKKAGLQMRIRSGGHDFEGTSYVARVPYFILDMFNFRKISIDLKSRTAWVEAGATIGETYYKIKEKNESLSFPGGYWPTLGVGGHISGGGYGPLVRNYGLAADNVIDVRIINVRGRLLKRNSMGEDLFWAIRGGVGSCFGVILSYRIQLVEVPKSVIAFIVKRNLKQDATKLVYKFQQIAPKLPVEWFLSVRLSSIILNPFTGEKTIEARFTSYFRGKVGELISIANKYFPELGLVKQDCQVMTWVQYYAFHLGQPIDRVDQILTNRVPIFKSSFKAKAEFIQRPIPEDGLERIWRLFLEEEVGAVEMQWTPFGGIMDQIPESAIPFPHRAGNSFVVFKAVYWSGPDRRLIDRRLDWMKRLHNLMGDYVDRDPRGAYAAFRDLDLGANNVFGPTKVEEARVWGTPYFKNNFDRLAKVKTDVDPHDFFRNEQSIPPLSLLASS